MKDSLEFIVLTALLCEPNETVANHCDLMDPVPEDIQQQAQEWDRLEEKTVYRRIHSTLVVRRSSILSIHDLYPGYCQVRTTDDLFAVKGCTLDIYKQLETY